MREFGAWRSSGDPSVLVILSLSVTLMISVSVYTSPFSSLYVAFLKHFFPFPRNWSLCGTLVWYDFPITGIITGYFPFQILKENLLASPQALNCWIFLSSIQSAGTRAGGTMWSQTWPPGCGKGQVCDLPVSDTEDLSWRGGQREKICIRRGSCSHNYFLVKEWNIPVVQMDGLRGVVGSHWFPLPGVQALHLSWTFWLLTYTIWQSFWDGYT